MSKLNAIFKDYKVPKTLKELEVFENSCNDFYSFMFSLNDDPDESMIENLFENEYVSSRLIEFACADENGAMFALWLKDEGMDLEQVPVIYVSEDCEVNVLALNLKDFLVMLSFDEDCGGDFYYKDGDDYEQSPYHKAYCTWLKEKMKLEPIKTYEDGDDELNPIIESLIKKAVDEHKLSFDTWIIGIENILENSDDLSEEEIISKIKMIDLNPVEDDIPLDMTTINLPLSMDDFIDLLDVPMDNEELLKSIISLGFDRPKFNASYLRDDRIEDRIEEEKLWYYIEDRDSVVSVDVIPQLSSLHNNGSDLAYPFGIVETDSYTEVLKKLPSTAKEVPEDDDDCKQWNLKREDGLEYELHVEFDDDNCTDVYQISIYRAKNKSEYRE